MLPAGVQRFVEPGMLLLQMKKERSVQRCRTKAWSRQPGRELERDSDSERRFPIVACPGWAVGRKSRSFFEERALKPAKRQNVVENDELFCCAGHHHPPICPLVRTVRNGLRSSPQHLFTAGRVLLQSAGGSSRRASGCIGPRRRRHL